jgi:hypothetical protein
MGLNINRLSLSLELEFLDDDNRSPMGRMLDIGLKLVGDRGMVFVVGTTIGCVGEIMWCAGEGWEIQGETAE